MQLVKTHNTITEDQFDLRHAAITNWVENLPLGSTGESSKQLYHALKTVNRQENTFVQHLNFLEQIAPTLSLLYPRLSKHFIDISLPLSTKTKNVLHVTTSLLNEVLSGYHSVAKSLLAKKPFGWKKSFSLVLHNSLIYSSQVLCTQRLSYQPNAKGMWRQIFWCYQQAEVFNLQNKSFNGLSDSDEKTSIAYEFKKLLLLSMLSVNDVGQKSMKEIYSLMPLWVKHAEVQSKETSEKQTCFTLNLLSDHPPYLIGTRNENAQQSSEQLFFSTTKLRTLLTMYMDKIGDESTINLNKNILSKPTIKALLSSWSRDHLRTNVRKEGSGFVDIVTGITAIHAVLNQHSQPAYDEASVDESNNSINFESTLTIKPINNPSLNTPLNLDHFLSTSDEEEDIWGKVYENNAIEIEPVNNWTDSGPHKTYDFTKSILLDYSKDGYRLSVNVQKIDSLKHNELIAVREHALAPWALAQVKWLHFSKLGDVQFGLRVLTHHVLPVHISYEVNKSFNKPLPCLLGLDTKKLILFVPSLPTNLCDKPLRLEHQTQKTKIKLKQNIISTNAFDAYQIIESSSAEQVATKSQHPAYDKPEITNTIWNDF